MGGKRAAEDQHEILDLLYTKETDKRAKKMARDQAKSDKAARKVPKATKVRKVRKPKIEPVAGSKTPRPGTSSRGATAAVAAVAVAVAGFGLYTSGFFLDEVVRQDQATCAKFLDALPEERATTAQAAEMVAADLYRLTRYKMSSEMSGGVQRTAQAYLALRNAIESDESRAVIDSTLARVEEQVQTVEGLCSSD